MRSETKPADPLQPFRERLKWEQDRYKDISIGDYIDGVLKKKFSPPPKNAAELVVRALTRISPVRNIEAGFIDYPVFSQRDDELAIKGIPRTVETLMRALGAEAKLNTRDKGILLVTPTGGGKSTMIGIPILELEKFTDSEVPPPVFGIKDCPINEEPLNVLDDATREIFKKEYGISVEGRLCPDCRDQSELMKGTMDLTKMGQGSPIPLDLKVRALPFSAAQGRGITRLESSVTKSVAPLAGLISKAILGSNRGILHLPELGEHPIEFLRTLNDFFRGRQYSTDGKTYKLDTVILADMTLPQWEVFSKNPGNRSLLERLDVVLATYPLDSIAELAIINKRLFTSGATNLPHLSPQTLESSAEVSVRSRYRRGSDQNDIKISEAEKSHLYKGENIGEYTQQRRKEIEQQGRTNREGEIGISPPGIWGVIYKSIAEEMPGPEEDQQSGCVDFLELKTRLTDHIIKDPNLSDDDKQQALRQLDEVAVEYDSWLLRTIKQAFLDNFSARATGDLKRYLDNVIPYLEGQKVEDYMTELTGTEGDPDDAYMQKFENALSGGSITFVENDDNIPEGERHKKMTRRRFRFNLQQSAAKIKTKQGRDLKWDDFLNHLDGFIRLLQGERDIKKLGASLDILKNPKPQDIQAEELNAMKERLVNEYSFCSCCKDKLVAHISNQIRQGKLT